MFRPSAKSIYCEALADATGNQDQASLQLLDELHKLDEPIRFQERKISFEGAWDEKNEGEREECQGANLREGNEQEGSSCAYGGRDKG